MDFADDMLSSLDLCGQKHHGMAAVANGTISDDVTVLEELGRVRKEKYHIRGALLTSTSCR